MPTPRDHASQVRVGVRIRPLTPKETSEGGRAVVDANAAQRTVSLSKRKFTYDSVFHSAVAQADLYANVAPPLLSAFLNGYNATVLAYGQTGSGKTYTVGSEANGNSSIEDLQAGKLSDNDGLIPRFMVELFDSLVAKREDSERDFQRRDDVNAAEPATSLIEFRVSASFLEVYGDDIHDLLDGERHALKIREDSNKDVIVVGLRQQPISNAVEAMHVLNTGTMHRTTAATLMNSTSSRSHAVFTINLQQTLRGTEGDEMTTAARFTFVDLAGSERMKKTGAEGARAREGIKINEGLLALGNVINALADDDRLAKGERIHVPYRQSKLTRLLQDALGGNSQTFFLACVSPSDTNASETLSTLHYANRARNIRNAPTRNVDATAEELRRLRALSALLRCELVKHRFSGVVNPIATDPEVERANNENAVNPAEIGCIDDDLLHREDVLAYMKQIEDKVSQLSGSTLAYSSSFAQNGLVPLLDVSPPTPPQTIENTATVNVSPGKEDDDEEIDVNPGEDIQIIEELLDHQNNEQISNIQGDIEEQEERLLQLKEHIRVYHDMKEKYELLVDHVEKLEQEKALLAEKLEKAQSGSPKSSLSIKTRLESIKISLTKARQDVRKQQQKCREAEQDAQRCKGLECRINEMKKTKAAMIKTQKEDAKRRQEFSKTKSREIQQLRRNEKSAQKKVTNLESECQRYKANLTNSKARYEKLSNKFKQSEANLKQATAKMRKNGALDARREVEPGGDESGHFAPASGKINSIKFVLDKTVADRVALHQNREVYAVKVIECENLVQSMAREVKLLNELKRDCEAMDSEHFGQVLAQIHAGEEIVQEYLIKVELVENHLEELRERYPSIEENSKGEETKGNVFGEHEPALKMISKLNSPILRTLLLKLLGSCFTSELGRQRMKHELANKTLVQSTLENEVMTQNEKISLLSKSLASKSQDQHPSKETEKYNNDMLEETAAFISDENVLPLDLENTKEALSTSEEMHENREDQGSRNTKQITGLLQKIDNLRTDPEASESLELQRAQREAEEQHVSEVECATNNLKKSHAADEENSKANTHTSTNSSQSGQLEQFKAYHNIELARVHSEAAMLVSQAIAQTKELLTASHAESIENLRAELNASAFLELELVQAEAKKQRVSQVKRATNDLQESHRADLEKLRAELGASASLDFQQAEARERQLLEVRRTTNHLKDSHEVLIEPPHSVASSHKDEMALLRSEIEVSSCEIPEDQRPVTLHSQQVQTESIKGELNSLLLELEKTKEALSLSEERNAKAEKQLAQICGRKLEFSILDSKQIGVAQDTKGTPPTTPHRGTYPAMNTPNASSDMVTTPSSVRSSPPTVLPNFSKFDDLKQRYRKKFRNSSKKGDDAKPERSELGGRTSM